MSHPARARLLRPMHPRAMRPLALPLMLLLLLRTAAAQQLTKKGFGRDRKPLTNAVQPNSGLFRRRERLPCPPNTRTLTGVCTNPFFKLWGSTGRPQLSLRPLHSSVVPGGAGLPSARAVSNALCKASGDITNARGLNELIVFFGQFLDHNLVATPAGSERMPIPIPPDDDIFANFSSGTLPFTRSKRARLTRQSRRRRLDKALQRPINTLPAALDLVALYGPEEKRASALREGTGGRMRVSTGDLLPLNDRGLSNAPMPTKDFFLAGDHRSNEHPALTSLHTIFLREHNSLCAELAVAFPTWSDKRLFEEARKINIAQFQKVTLDEFVPSFTGRRLPPYHGFRPFTNPTVLDVFAAAAFRMHTMVGGEVRRQGRQGPLPSESLNAMFFRPAAKFSRTDLDEFIRGAAVYPAQEIDLEIKEALRNMLFQGIPGEDAGFDLAALNIQRGRDHALPSFNEVRAQLGLPRRSSFAGISGRLSVQQKLSGVYNSVDQVEAWIGMVAEDHAPGASMGHTMLTIWERQFTALRDGDRLYYERWWSFPKEVTAKIPRVKRLFQDGGILRDLIIRNTGIESSELPPRIFFRANT